MYIDASDLEAQQPPQDRKLSSLLYLTALLSFVLGVVELTAVVTGDDSTCANGRLLLPVQWSLGAGVISLSFSMITGAAALTYRWSDTRWRCGCVAWSWVLFTATILLAWNIVGSIVLWRDNNKCQGSLAQVMGVSILIKYTMVLYSLVCYYCCVGLE